MKRTVKEMVVLNLLRKGEVGRLETGEFNIGEEVMSNVT